MLSYSVFRLVSCQDPHLRRKALQMFTRRLDPASGGTAPSLSPGEEYLFVEMVPSLRMVAMGKSTRGAEETSESDPDPNANLEEVMGPSSNEEAEEGEESAVNRQTALLSLDVLARVLGRRHKDAFVGVVEDVTEIVAGTSPAALPGEKMICVALSSCLLSFFCEKVVQGVSLPP